MDLSPVEARVLGSLIEKERTVPDSYPLTLNSLRLACNQTSNRHPVVAYDDRTVDAALLSLKSQGLVRFVHASHGARTTRYRHVADERWRLEPGELAVLSVLVLRGAQTIGEIRARAERQHPFTELGQVEAALDTLAARTPEPFVARLEPRPGQKEARWGHLLCGEPVDDSPDDGAVRARRSGEAAEELTILTAQVVALEERVARLEAELGMGEGA